MPSPLEDAVSGAVGSVVAITCTYPLDLAKTRLQAQRRRRDSTEVTKPYTGAFDVLLRIVREEGPLQLYRGLLASCWKAAITNFVFFFALRVSKRRVRAAALLQGILAGVVVQLTILPVDMVVTRWEECILHAPWQSQNGSSRVESVPCTRCQVLSVLCGWNQHVRACVSNQGAQ